jgi:hypothetical protein
MARLCAWVNHTKEECTSEIGVNVVVCVSLTYKFEL